MLTLAVSQADAEGGAIVFDFAATDYYLLIRPRTASRCLAHKVDQELYDCIKAWRDTELLHIGQRLPDIAELKLHKLQIAAERAQQALAESQASTGARQSR